MVFYFERELKMCMDRVVLSWRVYSIQPDRLCRIERYPTQLNLTYHMCKSQLNSIPQIGLSWRVVVTCFISYKNLNSLKLFNLFFSINYNSHNILKLY